MPRLGHRLLPFLLLACCLAASPAPAQQSADAAFPLRRADRIVFIGNTFAERMRLFPHFEVLLSALRPADSLTFRNLGWSGDEISLRPRPLNFGDLHTHLAEQRADVVFAAFGMNESFAGAQGLPAFREDLRALLREMLGHHYNGDSPPRVVLVSPIPHERLERLPLDPAAHNRDLALYTEAMREVAAELGVRFVDLFTPMLPLMDDPALGDLTRNGIHLDDRGYEVASRLMARSLGWLDADPRAGAERTPALARLERAVIEKNQLFFYRWRAVNGEYIYGRRKEPFGVVNFPSEMRQLEEMIRSREQEIWRLARSVPARDWLPEASGRVVAPPR